MTLMPNATTTTIIIATDIVVATTAVTEVAIKPIYKATRLCRFFVNVAYTIYFNWGNLWNKSAKKIIKEQI